MTQCEFCDFEFEPTQAEQTNGCYACEDGVDRTFCSDACFHESEDDYRIGQMEARRELAMYGTDLDSWYR